MPGDFTISSHLRGTVTNALKVYGKAVEKAAKGDEGVFLDTSEHDSVVAQVEAALKEINGGQTDLGLDGTPIGEALSSSDADAAHEIGEVNDGNATVVGPNAMRRAKRAATKAADASSVSMPCLAQMILGDGSTLFCTLNADHDGDHVAQDPDDNVLAIWPRDVIEPTKAPDPAETTVTAETAQGAPESTNGDETSPERKKWKKMRGTRS